MVSPWKLEKRCRFWRNAQVKWHESFANAWFRVSFTKLVRKVRIDRWFVGWYRGFSIKNRAVKGIFPSTYVHLKPCKIENEGLFESVIPLEDPVVREVTLVLREWGGIWKRLYVVSESATLLLSSIIFPPPSFRDNGQTVRRFTIINPAVMLWHTFTLWKMHPWKRIKTSCTNISFEERILNDRVSSALFCDNAF